jgi:hypothetical protein
VSPKIPKNVLSDDSGCREQKLFENDTADEPRPAGAERAANRGVPHATQRPRERQVREVRARDQHDAADRAEEQQEPELKDRFVPRTTPTL